MDQPVVVDCLRTAVGRAYKGSLRHTRPDELAAVVIQALIKKYPQIPTDEIDDVILGCATPEAEAGYNVARVAALRAGLPDIVPAITVNRFCASGLEAIALAADRIRAGGARIVIAGGTESMSMLPLGGRDFAPNPRLVSQRPEAYLTMGLTAERVAQKWDISREDQDAFALRSHRNAVQAQAEARFEEEIVPVVIESTVLANGRQERRGITFSRDECSREDTSSEALAKLPPVFLAGGAITAGNSSQPGDGAAAALVMSEKEARELGLEPLARLAAYAVGGVPPEIMGIGPVVAVPKALALAGLELGDLGLIELNEAFAAQALAVIRLAGLDTARLNVNGGAIALGHPLGCTGAKLVATLLREMRRRSVRYGVVTMCVGGGQGAAGIFERM